MQSAIVLHRNRIAIELRSYTFASKLYCNRIAIALQLHSHSDCFRKAIPLQLYYTLQSCGIRIAFAWQLYCIRLTIAMQSAIVLHRNRIAIELRSYYNHMPLQSHAHYDRIAFLLQSPCIAKHSAIVFQSSCTRIAIALRLHCNRITIASHMH
jgi:hypothetical protein